MSANINIPMGEKNESLIPRDFTSLKDFLTFILYIYFKTHSSYIISLMLL